MVRPKLSDPFESEQSVGDGSEVAVAEYLETIAILQDEIVRLEQELQLQHEGQRETTSNGEGSAQNEAEAAVVLEHAADASEQIERFEAELASRDETIRLLLDELSRVEEAQAASRAEWDHLAGWVAELEHRVEGQDGERAADSSRIGSQTQEQKAEAIQVKFEQDRRVWESQRQIYQAEIARLQGALEQIATSSEDGRITPGHGPDSNVVEVSSGREPSASSRLARTDGAHLRRGSFRILGAQLAKALNERQQLRRQLEQIRDERKSESLEHEATVAELQARQSQAPPIPPQGPPPEKGPDGVVRDLDINIRVRALRQHLMEVDQLEKEERRQKKLISRLSRLWSRTGPR